MSGGDKTKPLAATSVRFDAAVVAEIVELSGGRPYYLQKLAYYAFDASEHGQVSEAQFGVAFGGDVFSLQRILGHSPASLKVTRRYVRLLDDDLRAVHRRVSPVDRL